MALSYGVENSNYLLCNPRVGLNRITQQQLLIMRLWKVWLTISKKQIFFQVIVWQDFFLKEKTVLCVKEIYFLVHSVLDIC